MCASHWRDFLSPRRLHDAVGKAAAEFYKVLACDVQVCINTGNWLLTVAFLACIWMVRRIAIQVGNFTRLITGRLPGLSAAAHAPQCTGLLRCLQLRMGLLGMEVRSTSEEISADVAEVAALHAVLEEEADPTPVPEGSSGCVGGFGDWPGRGVPWGAADSGALPPHPGLALCLTQLSDPFADLAHWLPGCAWRATACASAATLSLLH